MSSAPRFRKPTPASPFPTSSVFKNMGLSASNLKPSGISPSGGPSAYSNLAPNSPFNRDPSQIGAISTQRQKGFTVIDINPYTCSKATFPCGISPQVIGDLIGYEIDGDFTFAGLQAQWNTSLDVPNAINTTTGVQTPPLEVGNGTATGGVPNQNTGAGKTIGIGNYGPQNPWWRTVTLPGAGTWVKVEFLPSRVNDESIFAASANAFANFNKNPALLNTPNQTRLFKGSCRTGSSTNVLNCLANAGGNNGIWAWNDSTVTGAAAEDTGYGTKHSSNDVVLIQFDDPNSTPLIVKPGSAFELPFNTLYLTFKIRNPRIRVTVGNNAQVQEFNDSRIVNSQLHTAPGRGLFEHSVLHPVPFSLNTRNNGASIVSPGFSGFQVTTGGTSTKTLIQNADNLGSTGTIPPGIQVFWITSINFNVTCDTALKHHSVRLGITGGQGNGTERNIWFMGGIVTVANGMNSYVANITTPIRCMLRPGDALTLTVTNLEATNNIVYWFDITGYAMGPLLGSSSQPDGTSGSGPYRIMGSYTEQPFPLDNWWQGCPL